ARGLPAEEGGGGARGGREGCRARIARLRPEGIFTPPSLEGSVVFPGFGGGVNWGGIAYDPVRGLAIAPTNRLAYEVRLVPRDEFRAARAAGAGRGEFGAQIGTPYGMYREPLLSPRGLPCNPPPWGLLPPVPPRP